MFSKSGNTIKILAIVLFILGAFASLATALLVYVLMTNPAVISASALVTNIPPAAAVFASCVTFLFGAALSYIYAILIYSYGQLVDNSEYQRDIYELLLDRLEPDDYKRSSIEILENLFLLFEEARKAEDDEKMIECLKAGCGELPEDEQSILEGILQQSPAEVREIMRDFLEKHTDPAEGAGEDGVKDSSEILANLYKLFNEASLIEDDKKMVEHLRGGEKDLNKGEKSILKGMLQHSPAEVREIMRDFLERQV